MSQRSLHELLDTIDPMWPLIQQWLSGAAHPVEVLPAQRSEAETTLLTLQVTTRSPLGAMAWETGGLLVDDGWLRLLGAGNPRLRHSLLSWNGLGGSAITPPLMQAFVVGYDVLGGFFAINGGAFGKQDRSVFYFAPDSLQWEDLGLAYGDFLQWAITGNVAGFYGEQRWPGWQQEVTGMSGDQGFSFMPMLWAKGPPLGERSRRVVPQEELWRLHHDLARQLAEAPE
ncbi:MAG TPA: DUF2625 family protein [Ktedonobacterales bacterium]